jgi:hypothetical protein
MEDCNPVAYHSAYLIYLVRFHMCTAYVTVRMTRCTRMFRFNLYLSRSYA